MFWIITKNFFEYRFILQMYKLILNGKLDTKTLKTKDEIIKELTNLDQTKIVSVNWVKV